MASRCEFSKINIPNDSKYAEAASRYVVEIAKMIGFDEQDVQAIELGVRETIKAVIEYSFEPGERASMELTCERIGEGLKVAVKDKGLPFGVTATSFKADEIKSGTYSTLGRQVFRLNEFMDEVLLHNLGREGKEIVLIKHLKSKTITDYYAECDLEPYPMPMPEITTAPQTAKCSVRQMNPSEAAEVSKSVYKTYGYSYAKEYVYYPEKIIALNESGRIHSAVAVSGSGEIAGHCALQYWEENPRIAELAAGVVKPEFRAQGCFAKMTEYLVDRAHSERIWGVFGQSVTNHTYSQRTGHQAGLNDCAVMLGLVPPTVTFKGFSQQLSHRLSMVMQFRYLNGPSSLSLYIPSHHQHMVAEIYENFGSTPNFSKDQNGSKPAQDSVFKIKVIAPLNFARITMEDCGKDAVGEIGAKLKELCLKKIEVVHLYLNLFDPLTTQLTKEFERLGFFFAGLLPGGLEDGDALILQYLNNVPIDYSAIRLESDLAVKILSHIKRHVPNLV